MRRPEPGLTETLVDLERALVVALGRVRAVVDVSAHSPDGRKPLLDLHSHAACDLHGKAPALPDPVSYDCVFDALREWRAEVAGTKPRYTVCRDDLLQAVARERPQTLSDLAGLPEVGRAFVTRHGESILTALRCVAPSP